MGAVRCHAVVCGGKVTANAVVSYDDATVPHDDAVMTIADAGRVSVVSMGMECHSTVDYNGIAVVGMDDVPQLTVTADNIRQVVQMLAEKSMLEASGSNRITFIPLTAIP